MRISSHGTRWLGPPAVSALLLLSACSSGAADLPSDVLGTTESAGAICSPVDSEGLASFASEIVTNTSDSQLTLESVEAAESNAALGVEEWFLAPVDWDGPGAAPGGFADRPQDFDATVIEPGERAILAVTLAGDAASPTGPERLMVDLRSEAGGQGRVALGYTVATAPAEGACA